MLVLLSGGVNRKGQKIQLSTLKSHASPGRMERGGSNKSGQTFLRSTKKACSKKCRIQQFFIPETFNLLLQVSFYLESS